MDGTKKLKALPKGAKIAATKSLKGLGFANRKIADILGIDKDTVSRYTNVELGEEWGQFADSIKKIWIEQDFELSQLAIERIRATIHNAKLYQAIGLLKTVREFNLPQGKGIGVNIGGEQIAVQVVRGSVTAQEVAEK